MSEKDQYLIFSRLFMYPKEGYKEHVGACMQMLEKYHPDAAKQFSRFYSFIQSKHLYEIEEIFGVTFHIQAICFLDLGYVLFGEDYTRGEFLVNMKREQEKINHDCGEELADNLPHVLQLLSISKEISLVQELAVRCVIPAIEKMLTEFKSSRMELKNKVIRKKQKAIILEGIIDGNIYQNALQALLTVLKKDFAGITYNDQKIEQSLSNFIPNCGDCSTETATNDKQKLKTVVK